MYPHRPSGLYLCRLKALFGVFFSGAFYFSYRDALYYSCQSVLLNKKDDASASSFLLLLFFLFVVGKFRVAVNVFDIVKIIQRVQQILHFAGVIAV